MKRIELAELKKLGATEKQIIAYNGTDPLSVWEQDDGLYTVVDCDGKHKGLTSEEMLDILDGWYVDE